MISRLISETEEMAQMNKQLTEKLQEVDQKLAE